MKLKVLYKNGYIDEFTEKDIDCGRLTIMGHAANINDFLYKGGQGYYKLDSYNTILLESVISIRVIK